MGYSGASYWFYTRRTTRPYRLASSFGERNRLHLARLAAKVTSTPQLSIIILNWNVADLLAACLDSLPEACGAWWPQAEVIVVDNASSDGSARMVRDRFPNVRLTELPTNTGFTGGNNAGIRASTGDYIFLLNPDTLAHPGSIAALADYIDAHPNAGIVGPRLLNLDGTLQPSRRRFPTLATALVESTPLQRARLIAPLRNRRDHILSDFYMLDRPDDETQQVGWLSGAALMCRREALMQAGWFDPGYFMFSEEVDLCRRVSDSGWSVVYLPHEHITHYGGQSTTQDIPARHIHFNTSKVRYFRIHEGRRTGAFVRRFLLTMYAAQLVSESAKWLLGHKRPLRARRIKLYTQVLKSGLRDHPGSTINLADVLLITGEYPPARGGVGDYTCKLHRTLNQTGTHTHVLTQTNSKSANRDKDTNPKSKIPYTNQRITPAATLRALRGSGARIAHIQYQTAAFGMRPTINLLPWLLKRKWAGKVVVTFHDLRAPYIFPRAGPVREWANRLLARTADAAIATNDEDYAVLHAWGVKRVRLIPIGSNIPDCPPHNYNREAWRASHGIHANATLLAYFGFLNSTKGLDTLLHALANLRERGDFRLLMVGGGLGSSDPTNRATATELDTLARRLGVQDALIWTGYLAPEEVSAALHAANIAVLPFADGASFRRGSMLAVLQHGLPLITTTPRILKSEAESQNQQLVDGHNVLLFEASDPKALIEAIGRLSRDQALRARLSGGALELAKSYSWERIAQLHSKLYRELDREA